MARTSTIIAVAYGILGGLVVLVIGFLVVSSTLGGRREIDARKLGDRERTWFGIVVVLLVALLFATIFFTPYGRGESGQRGQRVDVTAQQFAFILRGKQIKAGKPVVFHLTAKDVNHGFAVFNSNHTFLFQVQVMPKKTQLYRYTFKQPGTYTVECYEYCGLDHDKMVSTFTVTR